MELQCAKARLDDRDLDDDVEPKYIKLLSTNGNFHSLSVRSPMEIPFRVVARRYKATENQTERKRDPPRHHRNNVTFRARLGQLARGYSGFETAPSKLKPCNAKGS